MTQKEMPKSSEPKVYAETRGRYTIVDGNKVYHFDFPATSKLGENYEILKLLKEETWKAMENQKKMENEKSKEEEKKKIITP